MRPIFYYFKIAFLLTFCLVTGTTVFAQQTQTITGKVIDAADRTAVIGANVRIKGINKGAVTDASGIFKLNASPEATLVISYIGYLTKEVPVAMIHGPVLLTPDAKTLNTVVVTALGISKQSKALGYSVQTLTANQIASVPDPNLVNDLQGKVAGVQITNGSAGVGSTSRIVIRGENSFSGTNQPLFVVDGVPISNDTYFNDAVNNSSNQGTWAEVDWGNGASELNPNDVEKMTVLKGPAAAALYGARASNGAIVITTKKGRSKDGLVGVTFNSQTTVETVMRFPELQNQYGAGNGSVDYKYVNGGGSTENNIPNFGRAFDPNYLVVQFDSPQGPYMAADLNAVKTLPAGTLPTPTPWVAHTDNLNKFFGVGVTTQNNISFATGDDRNNYRFSVGNLYNHGNVGNIDLMRNMFSFRAENKYTDKLSSSIYVNYINSSSDNRPNIGYGSENVMYTFHGVYGMPLNVNIESLKKLWAAGQTDQTQFRYWNNHDNPYLTVNDNTNSFKKNRIIGNAQLNYQFTPELSAFVRTGIDTYTDDRQGERVFGTVRFPNGGFRTDNVTYVENNTDFLLNYKPKNTGEFHVNVAGGGNRFKQSINYVRNIANSLIAPDLYNFSNALTLLPPEYIRQERATYSLYGFGDIDYKGLVYLNVTGRNDWSSTLPTNRNSYFYPSASLSAIVSDIFKMPEPVSFFKIRLSGAQVGHDADPYSINNTFTTITPFNSTPLTTITNTLANSNLKPSTTDSYEGGFEIRFLKDRIGLDATYYISNTKDEIVQVPVPISSGYSAAFVNGGKIRDKGIELVLNAAPLRSENGLNWTMTFNFSHDVSTVTGLPDGLSSYKYADVTQYDRYYRSIQYNAVVGERFGNIYGRYFKRAPDGQIIYQNGLPVTSDETDRKVLGNYNPDFILGWYNNFSYKNFNFGMTWDWRQGGSYYSYTELGLLQGGMSPLTLPGRTDGIVGQGVMLNANGTYSPNTVKVTAANYYLNGIYNPNNNEEFIYSATYLKLREVKLGYTFKHILGKQSPASLNASLVGRNLLLFTQNKDVDPENLALRGNKILPGIEFLSYPSTRSFGFNVNFSF
ncbi:SusC/RagA family TonB-linked outer membrane protein [Mucilaginibacter rubeus]|uniref:SusC/RagA family TonB-linked outer membrane protein n=1 Tax=Mucilaginibacter rubeus TaxID=2027860 RepID=A0AAE6JJ99_9SPHI|nr:SusC/RagA family TonB-linked outer membrane protein [Mucilaginibacter rubeus]QEM06448.1 SusC/RagA family TonB-linked outer membrane protein [Mucilaginibacter rubeus]QTE44425.1 SusC/RagA family TonB-linked outer membrane protein [Mucilaginibacter rubeus]QTE51024.1 SusC/RagA family TonB-linked outer membrane protein [Mucilaginibacter rubeus]QTE56107.1 SusC/RagA family TonB-linked outer membrane protein [Mucilaginibacter rubeus]QTE64428.1 SusC/RagA family TonB-linked outer membrane protein [Mu